MASKKTSKTTKKAAVKAPKKVTKKPAPAKQAQEAQQAAPEPKTVSLKCRREGCTSIKAIETTPAAISGNGNLSYCCPKCGWVWHISVGGSVSF